MPYDVELDTFAKAERIKSIGNVRSDKYGPESLLRKKFRPFEFLGPFYTQFYEHA